MLFFKGQAVPVLLTLPDNQKNAVIYAIELRDDETNRDQIEMVMTMKDSQIPVEDRINDGDYNWVLWHKSLPNAMKFVGECFLQTRFNPFVMPRSQGIN